MESRDRPIVGSHDGAHEAYELSLLFIVWVVRRGVSSRVKKPAVLASLSAVTGVRFPSSADANASRLAQSL